MKNFVFISPHFPDHFWKFCISLKNHGYNILGIGDALYEEIPDECKFALTEYYCCSQMDNLENEIKALEYFKAKYGEFAYLESNNEYWLRKDGQLRDKFNIKSGFNHEEISKLILKSNQKEYYSRAGVKCARSIVSKDIEELKKFVADVNYPIFAKPNCGVGSQNTFKINNDLDLELFTKKIRDGVEYIFEEFIHGKVISYDGICNNNSEVIFAVEHIFLENNAEVVDSELDDMYYCLPQVDAQLDEIGRRCVKEFGLRNRFFHLEFFILESDHPYLGKKGTMIPLEANLRPAGGYTTDMINFSQSTSCYDIYADVLDNGFTTVRLDNEKFYCVSSSRRDKYHYLHSNDEIIEKYRFNLCMVGTFPKVLSDDMGDSYYMAKFKIEAEVFEFDEFVRTKKD